jgi:MoxR-like ATPase
MRDPGTETILTMTPPKNVVSDGDIDERLQRLANAQSAVGAVVHGQREVIDQVLVGMMSAGHVLLEGSPGLGKTLLVRTLGAVCGMHFSRIQFTPDLMPADITGSVMLQRGDGGSHAFQPGPLFAQMVLTDEINRATPKTQSALLEAMQERTVTVAGVAHPLPAPFFVLATQNPIEMEGTYVLPEAQIDRFLLNVVIPYPQRDVLDVILDQTTGVNAAEPVAAMTPDDVIALQHATRALPIGSGIRAVVVELLHASLPHAEGVDPRISRYVRFGITPRGGQALIIAAKAHALMHGRHHVGVADLRAMLSPALRHRFQVNYVGEAEGISATDLLHEVFERTLARAAA